MREREQTARRNVNQDSLSGEQLAIYTRGLKKIHKTFNLKIPLVGIYAQEITKHPAKAELILSRWWIFVFGFFLLSFVYFEFHYRPQFCFLL